MNAEPRASWLPLVIIAMAQIFMIFNVSTLQVSIEGIASSFNTSATTVGSAIVAYALVVAAFILLGARIAQMLGSRRVFRISVLLFGAGMAIMATSIGVPMMIAGQITAGAAAAALVPTLVVLVADNYKGRQQEQALGWLGGAPAMGIVLAFLIAGSLATWLGWRVMFGLLTLAAAGIYKLSDKLSPAVGQPVSIDRVGVALAALSILFISVGCNNLITWGTLLARPDAPFSIVDMSPAPLMILVGIFLGQAFISWSRRQQAAGHATLVALQVVDTAKERAALGCIFIISALASAITFLIPLYVQVVQGGSSFDSALAVIPFSVASFVAAVLVVRLYGRMGPSLIARNAFLLVAVGLALLGAVVRNDWSNAMVMVSMAIAGLGEGALVTLLFNVLVSSSPKELAGDVGSGRGAVNNLATAVGTALATAFVIGILSVSLHANLVHNADIPIELKSEVNLDNVQFVSNDQLRSALASTSATPAQVDEAVLVNTDARLLALKLTFFAFAGFALLAFFPAGALPAYERGEVPAEAQGLEPEEHPHERPHVPGVSHGAH
ncbi:MAG TPA: MFS transporter [Gammaproteobacteria bacterium]